MQSTDDPLSGTPRERAFRFLPGRNCWRVEHASRLAVLVDGEAYFAALRRSLIRARRFIAISAWDIHSRVELVRSPGTGKTDGDADDGLPATLGDLLLALLERSQALDVYILLWSYAPIYALEREPLFFGDTPWEAGPLGRGPAHPRLHFIKDDAHPLAASQHQKIVSVDGRIAWCGGFDISKWRWDTNRHKASDPRRLDPDGSPYPPFHDIQVLVDGDAAAALTELFVERWRRAGGTGVENLTGPTDIGVDHRDATSASDPWPEQLQALVHDQQVAIARTLPKYREHAEVREVERLYLDTIDHARDLIYIENQYLTSRTIADALCHSLCRDQGPQILILLPRQTGHWLEQHTMDILRARVLDRLRDADRHARLRVYYPDVPGLTEGCLMVHAKLMIVDDEVLRIGSSNLSNRSMGLDSECDLCIVAGDEETRRAIVGLRRRLLAMFLSVSPEAVAEAEARAGGPGGEAIAAIEALRSDAAERSGAAQEPEQTTPQLAELDGQADPEWDQQLPDERLIDPDRALDADLVTDVVVGKENTGHLRWRLAVGVGLIGLLLAMAAAWRWTALGDWLEPQMLAETVRGLGQAPWGPPAGLGGFVAASLVGVPVTLLILVSALVFGPATGALVALIGSMLSAWAGYGIGEITGRAAVERLAGGRLERLSRRLARRGILTMITVRIVPVAPFAVLNLFAGASHLRLRDFLIGTLIGMLPGVLAMAVFAEGLLSLIGRTDLRAVALVLVGLLSLGGLVWAGRRALRADD
jgi:phosphatidylserine/phosphatidylglycerophosphate/cardiolipin synthase-like enzyme/uncharacterized membrane protein YdjX (TVP38/TMEM64 family)